MLLRAVASCVSIDIGVAGAMAAGAEGDRRLRRAVERERGLDAGGHAQSDVGQQRGFDDRPSADGGAIVNQGGIAADAGAGALVEIERFDHLKVPRVGKDRGGAEDDGLRPARGPPRAARRW